MCRIAGDLQEFAMPFTVEMNQVGDFALGANPHHEGF